MGVEVKGFEDLPEFCVIEILRRCEEEDILNFQAVSSWACSIARVPSLWKTKLEEQYRMVLPHRLASSYAALQKLHRKMVDQSGNELLHFRGALTDGGVQEGRSMFWVDNMFDRKPSLTYCSDILERDVRCVGLHRMDRSSWDYSIQELSGDLKRKVLYDEGILKDLKEGSSGCNSNPSLIVTQQIVIGRMGDISCPVSCGLVLLGDFDAKTGKNQEEDMAQQLYTQAGSDLVDRLSVMKDLEMVLMACKRREILPPMIVGAKSMGEWVEFRRVGSSSGGMQPALWFRFFQKDETLQGNKERWETLKRDFQEVGTECRFPDCSEVDYGTEPIDQAIELLDNEYLEAEPLQPVPEVHLWQEAISLFNATHRFMLGREHMAVELERPCVGNAVCTVLISCENWMAQTWVRGGPNVDINFVYMIGKELSLNEIMGVEGNTAEGNHAKEPSGNHAVESASPGTSCEDDSLAIDELVCRINRIWYGKQV